MSTSPVGHPPAAAAPQVDLVCGMTTNADTELAVDYGGQRYVFCSDHCRARFQADPERYLDSAGDTDHHDHAGQHHDHRDHGGHHHGHGGQHSVGSVPVGEVAEYTCPMHPEIRQPGPGSCPICGMALEPVLVTADTGPSEVCAGHEAPLLGQHGSGGAGGRAGDGPAPARPPPGVARGQHVAPLLLATPVVLWGGWPFFVRGWRSLVTREPNMFTLIAMGIGVAWLYSVVATVAPGIFPAAFRTSDDMTDGMSGGTVDVYFEAAAVITVLVLLGQVLELPAPVSRPPGRSEHC